MTMTFSPALGWPAGIAIATLMTLGALTGVVLHWRRRPTSDETVTACCRRAVICLIVAVMALTPSTMSETTTQAVNGTDVVIAVDVTGSMAVRDAHYGDSGTISRLEAAQRAVSDMALSYANASFTGVRFGATSSVDVPLTPDTQAMVTWASTLGTEDTALSQGSSADIVLDRLLLTLKSIRDERPDDTVILYLITDGESTSSTTRRTFSSLRRYLTNAFTLGVGSTEGGRIPMTGNGENADGGPWVRDPATGQPGVSAMDPQELEALADEMSGKFVALDSGHTVPGQAMASMSSSWTVDGSAKSRQRVSPLVWPLSLALGVLLIWELGAWILMSRRLL